MYKKRTSVSSIDGFVPRSSASPYVGFDSPRQPKDSFPGVGMTLSSYSPRPGGTPTVDLQATPNISFELPQVSDRPATRAKKQRRRKPWKRIVAIILILLLTPVAWLGFKYIYNISKTFRGNPLAVLSTTKLKGEDQGRVNILLAGNSADDPLHQGGTLTDSIMIISVDTQNKSAFLLSVPRDLWVEIPGYGHAKINEAYVDGEDSKFSQAGYFPGGMGLLQEAIQQNFNINLQYYALVNYNAFRDMVNAVGGIDVNIQSPDKRGLYDPSIDYVTHGPLVKLTNGVHTLNGEQALDLARARGDAYRSYGFPQSDFDRTSHQRQMLLALRSKASSTGVVANPIKLSGLLDAVGSNIKTNFSLSEGHRLYDLTKDAATSGLQSVGLNSANGKNLLSSYTSPNGQSALVPAAGLDDFSDIQAYIKQITSHDPIVREGASVVVLNATDTSGLASKVAQTLKSKGLQIASIGDATTTQPTSSIIDLSAGKSPATKVLLTKLYGSTVTTTNAYANIYQADYIVLIGADQIPKPATN